MNFIKKNGIGILLCLAIAIPSWFLGKIFPVVGGAVIAIIAGMIITMFWNDKKNAEAGIKWTSKIILQTAVVLLGFGMNLGVIFQTGKQSLPIIICTITTSLVIAWILKKALKVPANTSILVGVGSSICGGSAIAATAPVVDADDEEYGLVIMKTVEENGEELLSTLDSDEEIEEIYNLFMERFFQEEDGE